MLVRRKCRLKRRLSAVPSSLTSQHCQCRYLRSKVERKKHHFSELSTMMEPKRSFGTSALSQTVEFPKTEGMDFRMFEAGVLHFNSTSDGNNNNQKGRSHQSSKQSQKTRKEERRRAKEKFLEKSIEFENRYRRFDSEKVLDEWIDDCVMTIERDQLDFKSSTIFKAYLNCVAATVNSAYSNHDFYGSSMKLGRIRMARLLGLFGEDYTSIADGKTTIMKRRLSMNQFNRLLNVMSLNCINVFALMTQLTHRSAIEHWLSSLEEERKEETMGKGQTITHIHNSGNQRGSDIHRRTFTPELKEKLRMFSELKERENTTKIDGLLDDQVQKMDEQIEWDRVQNSVLHSLTYLVEDSGYRFERAMFSLIHQLFDTVLPMNVHSDDNIHKNDHNDEHPLIESLLLLDLDESDKGNDDDNNNNSDESITHIYHSIAEEMISSHHSSVLSESFQRQSEPSSFMINNDDSSSKQPPKKTTSNVTTNNMKTINDIWKPNTFVNEEGAMYFRHHLLLSMAELVISLRQSVRRIFHQNDPIHQKHQSSSLLLKKDLEEDPFRSRVTNRPIPVICVSAEDSDSTAETILSFEFLLPQSVIDQRLKQFEEMKHIHGWDSDFSIWNIDSDVFSLFNEECRFMTPNNYMYLVPCGADGKPLLTLQMLRAATALNSADNNDDNHNNNMMTLRDRAQFSSPVVLGCLQSVDRTNGRISFRVSSFSQLFSEGHITGKTSSIESWLVYHIGPSGRTFSQIQHSLLKFVSGHHKLKQSRLAELRPHMMRVPKEPMESSIKDESLVTTIPDVKTDEDYLDMSADDSTTNERIMEMMSDISIRYPRLNESQRLAVATGLSEELSLVQGPPGTGKTEVAACIVSEWIQQRRRKKKTKNDSSMNEDYQSMMMDDELQQSKKPKILISGFSNVSVDVLCKRLYDLGITNVARVGFESTLSHHSTPAKYQTMLTSNLTLSERKSAIDDAEVVAATVVGCSSLLLGQCIFDLIIVDETSQCTEGALHIALSHVAKKMGNQRVSLGGTSSLNACLNDTPLNEGRSSVVLIGDHKQLPATIYSFWAKREGLSLSLFERLINEGRGKRVFLDTQYRMNPKICEFPSQYFYDGQLKTGKSVKRAMPEGFAWPKEGYPVCFIDMPSDIREEKSSTSRSLRNEAEAKVVCSVLSSLLMNGSSEPNKVCVITPYSAQKETIERMMREQLSSVLGNLPSEMRPIVRTVDGFQGSECDVIVFSAVRANEQGSIGFLDDPKRINVMLTRPKKGLILIGNAETLRSDPLWDAWLNKVVTENGSVLQSTEVNR